MLVFIDESGDAGFKVAKGSSPLFVAAMAIFADSSAAQTTELAIKALAASLRLRTEFKFNKTDDDRRDAFFATARQQPFTVRAIVVRKEVIYSPHLMADKEDFYRFFVRQVMQHDDGALMNARVVIDGSGDREFRRQLAGSLRRRLGDRLQSVKLSNSKNDRLLQLADMCAGAIARSYRRDRASSDRWRLMLAPRIRDIWDFR